MALISYPDKNQLSPEARERIEAFERKNGRPTMVRLMTAYFPPAQRAIDVMYEALHEGKLDARTKELIYAACSEMRGCFYCMSSHSRVLVKDLGLSRAEVEAARAGQPVEALTERQTALVYFARRVAERPRQIDKADMDALHGVGLDNAEIMEALTICMISAWTNTLANTLKFDQDMEAFGLVDGYF